VDGQISPEPDATLLLNAASAGDTGAIDRLLPLLYDQLRKAAQRELADERADHTLSATALVHEAYLKLVGPRQVAWQGRGHFYLAAAQAMRQILIDHARKHGAAKRGGNLKAIGNMLDLASEEKIADALALDELLSRLETEDPQAAGVVRLRFFAGLSIDETAQALNVSPRTIKRNWEFARAWLADAIRDAPP
jgi:RNA polymerase sigma factor (TIGR02999 family)